MSRRLNVVVGIAGGIAAYKAVGVIRLLVLAGHDVHVVATDAALRFVGRPTLEAISRNPVHTDLYEGVAQVRHVAIGQAADLIVVAPATANTIAKLAVGLADDLLGNTPPLAAVAPGTPRPSLDAIVAKVLRTRPGDVAQYIGFDPDRPIATVGTAPSPASPPDKVHNQPVDLRSGVLLAPPPQETGFMWFVETLHEELFLDLKGQLFLGVMGLLFIAAIVSGVVL